MISHEHKCIFIHIPKCAGTSIEAALGHLDGHVGRGGQDHRSIRRIEAPFLQPEILSGDFRICCANMNVEPIDLPHRNNSRIANFDDAYDGESIDLVASVYKEEIELFGYSF